MNNKKIIDYVMQSPNNTNPAVLESMLEALIGDGGSSGGDNKLNPIIAGTQAIYCSNSLAEYNVEYDLRDTFGVTLLRVGDYVHPYNRHSQEAFGTLLGAHGNNIGIFTAIPEKGTGSVEEGTYMLTTTDGDVIIAGFQGTYEEENEGVVIRIPSGVYVNADMLPKYTSLWMWIVTTE